jgi:hypothetical protein
MNVQAGDRQRESCWRAKVRMRERGREGRHAIIKEGKAFAVLFGDLTSHYPISPGPPLTHLARQPKSAASQRRRLQRTGQRSSMHTAACRFLFSLARHRRATLLIPQIPPALCFPCRLSAAELVSRDAYGSEAHRGSFIIPR